MSIVAVAEKESPQQVNLTTSTPLGIPVKSTVLLPLADCALTAVRTPGADGLVLKDTTPALSIVIADVPAAFRIWSTFIIEAMPASQYCQITVYGNAG
jgi:hypothetical protein